ncbi:MAG: helicase-related protein, partial [Pseudomonadota bacterium]
AMPLDRQTDFLAIDEIQLCADPERGHVFTNRLLRARGVHETMAMGSTTMRPLISRLLPHTEFLSRPRFSKLSYAGPKKLSRLPRRTAIVAFSAQAVYEIAELVRRQRGGAAIVMGALSPRTRNAQVAMYQDGDVDFLVATDAVGMGLNMDVDHVAFAATRKFDGRRSRPLTRSELAQIAGRAGRHLNDGSFGVTADCGALDEEDVVAIEEHEFDPLASIQWRNDALEFSSSSALLNALDAPPPRAGLTRAGRADDVDALRQLLREDEIRALASGGAALQLLWDVCQVPDFRKVSADAHIRLLADIYGRLMGPDGLLCEAWMEAQTRRLARTEGDVDALAQRIAHMRTIAFVANRGRWVEHATYWQEKTRTIENDLSDALHQRLTQRFVDRRTSVLMKRLQDGAPLLAGVTGDGEVVVEGQFVGRLQGFQFVADPRAKGVHGKALRAAALQALKPEIATRAARLASASFDELTFAPDGLIHWRESVVGRLAKGAAPLSPRVALVDDDLLSVHLRPKIRELLEAFALRRISAALEPLAKLNRAISAKDGEDAIDGLARGLGFRLVETLGALPRSAVAGDVRALDQAERGKLRKFGVRFGEYSVFLPALLKPAPARLRVLLWALWSDVDPAGFEAPPAGLTSVPNDQRKPLAYYYAAGFKPCGARAVRVDMLERIGELIREARQKENLGGGFEATANMMSLAGCSGEEFDALLTALGYRQQEVEVRVAASAPPRQEEAAPAQAEAAPDDGSASGSEGAPDTSAQPEAGDAPTPAADQPASLPAAPQDGAEAAAAADVPEGAAEAHETVKKTLWILPPRRRRAAPNERQRGQREQGARAGADEGRKKRGQKRGTSGARRDATGADANSGEKGGHAAKGRRGQKRGKPDDRGRPQPSGRADGPKGARGKQHRREKPMDPDSPFAILQQLKDKKSDRSEPAEDTV